MKPLDAGPETDHDPARCPRFHGRHGENSESRDGPRQRPISIHHESTDATMTDCPWPSTHSVGVDTAGEMDRTTTPLVVTARAPPP